MTIFADKTKQITQKGNQHEEEKLIDMGRNARFGRSRVLVWY